MATITDKWHHPTTQPNNELVPQQDTTTITTTATTITTATITITTLPCSVTIQPSPITVTGIMIISAICLTIPVIYSYKCY
ncbi:hypothetical protein E2C01_099857 [Portunus trituberculatus]|uniref:Uncharacterized protein n=1 Tax=Portunus trituberculatus TaxID=210409 RepID=A0A5B7K6K8_PORTR|nr:hypothetical protein [Portunus trituberculatus]